MKKKKTKKSERERERERATFEAAGLEELGADKAAINGAIVNHKNMEGCPIISLHASKRPMLLPLTSPSLSISVYLSYHSTNIFTVEVWELRRVETERFYKAVA